MLGKTDIIFRPYDKIEVVADIVLRSMLAFNFPKIVRKIFKDLPKKDYPVLSTFNFVSCWIGFSLDRSLTSMTDLFYRLKVGGYSIHKSTFSKASKKRDPAPFIKILAQLKEELSRRNSSRYKSKIPLFPIDSTSITLTSKLLFARGYNRVKLFAGLNSVTSEVEGVVIHFGCGHDSKYGNETIESTPQNGVSIMDRGFCQLNRLEKLRQKKDRFFVMRIKNNIHLEMQENGEFKLGTGKDAVQVRMVNFCNLETQTEYRLATNLPTDGEEKITNEEVGEIYIQRWQIELLWKFLKMHLKLDRLITKNPNGIEIQIYSCLIAYLILNLVKIPKEFGVELLDRLRYLQAFMCQKISYFHWFRDIAFCG